MRRNSHVRFGERAEETDRPKDRHRASVRLNHTAVALWIAAGATPKDIATRAGHTSVSVVLDRYGHLLPGTQERVTDALDAMARAASATPQNAEVRALR